MEVWEMAGFEVFAKSHLNLDWGRLKGCAESIKVFLLIL